jgi:peptidoglycan-N-acetylglucosamine deacetylase
MRGSRRAAAAVVAAMMLSLAPGVASGSDCPSGWVALTFDDGPGVRTAAVLDVLAARGAPGTFFVLGCNVTGRADLVRRTTAEGHRIGLHTYGHEYLTRLSAPQILATLSRTEEVVRAAGGVPAPLVRPPGGATGARVQAVLASAGYAHVLWTVDPFDWQGPPATTVTARVLAQARAGGIVLLHDGNAASQVHLALPGIIDGLRARGFCLGLLDDQGHVVSPAALGAFAPPQHVDVIAGTNRFATALQVSRYAWPSAPAAVVVSGEDFADALAAAPLAGLLAGPLLLTPDEHLYPGVLAELQRLGATRVVVVGRVGDTVVGELQGTGMEVTVLRGVDRYATSTLVAEEVVALGGDPSTVLLATGREHPDGLAAGAIAAHRRHPVLLVGPGEDSARIAALMQTWGTASTLVLGGRAAVEDLSVLGLPAVTRLAGPDRVSTAIAAAGWAIEHGFMPQPVLASGEGFPDGLVSGVLGGRLGRPLLLTTGVGLPSPLQHWMATRNPGTILTVGGSAAVCPTTVCHLRTGTLSPFVCPSG